MSPGTILVTGGAGYIGSHTVAALRAAGWQAVVLDNFCNSKPAVMDVLAQLTGSPVPLVQADVADAAALDALFVRYNITAVIHFAALKAVGESVAEPVRYYRNNLGGLLSLCEAMDRHNVRKLVFSSSATVYGNPPEMPIPETSPLSCTNPYGQTKLMSEQILADLALADPRWHIATLRYFNPIGAHASGLIGEDPNGVPSNLLPYVAQVATGERDAVRVFGTDYPTPDGTGVRDYIHVEDLAEGHLAALDYLMRENRGLTVNLGTGRGYSVLEVIRAFEAASGKSVPHEAHPRRAGDIAACWADPTLARTLLGWQARHDLPRMCVDAWRYASGIAAR